MSDMSCPTCQGKGELHDADFSNGDSDQQMFLKQDTLRTCPTCEGTGKVGIWGEDPDHPVLDWQYEVGNNDTRLGYWEWVAHRREGDE